MVRHLQQIDLRQPPGQEQRVDVILDVAGQQETSTAELPQQHDRRVVHAPVVRCAGIQLGRSRSARVRPENPQRGVIQADRTAGRQPSALEPVGGQPGQPRTKRRARTRHARIEGPAHAVALQHRGQAGNMIVVGVGQDDRVQAPVPGRDVAVQFGDERGAVGAAVHQDPTAAIALDQDRVALPHVQHDDMDAAVGPGGDDAAAQGDRERTAHDGPAPGGAARSAARAGPFRGAMARAGRKPAALRRSRH
jgi:hypothetical protein